MGYARPEPLGNFLTDAVGFVEHIFSGGSSGGAPPGWGTPIGTNPQQLPQFVWFQYGTEGGYVTADESDDLATVTNWAQSVRENGMVPTRMPSGRDGAGELASRVNGPGTNIAADPPYTYALAADDIRAADARLRNSDRTARILGAIIPAEVIAMNAAMQSAATFLDQYKWWILGAAGAVVILPMVIGERR